MGKHDNFDNFTALVEDSGELTEEQIESKLKKMAEELLGGEVHVIAKKVAGPGVGGRKEIWNHVMGMLTSDDAIERSWVISNPERYGCTDSNCTASDGAVVWVVDENETIDEDFPEVPFRQRVNAVWVASINDHLSDGTPVGLDVDAAEKLRDALTEAINIIKSRG